MFTDCVSQAFKLCLTGEEGCDLSYNSLTSEKAKTKLAERMKNSQEFSSTLFRVEPIGTEDNEVDADEDEEDSTIEYDEIDSSKTLDEEIGDLMTVSGVDDPSDEGEVCVGTDLDQFIGYEFSTQAATAAWMNWNAKGSH